MKKIKLQDMRYQYEYDEITCFEHPMIVLFDYLNPGLGFCYALLSKLRGITSFIDTKNYKSTTFSPHSLAASFNIRVSKVSSTKPKLLRVALVWDKVNTVADEHMTGAVVSSELDMLKLKVTTPSGEVYTSEYFYDTKQYVSFIATEAGSYKVEIIRTGTTSSNQFINYAFAYTVQSE